MKVKNHFTFRINLIAVFSIFLFINAFGQRFPANLSSLPSGPAPNLPPRPAYLGSLIDSKFGGKITRVTNVNGWRTGYPMICAWSCNGTYISLNGDQRRILDGKTYKYLHDYSALQGNGATPWSNVDDDLIYGSYWNANAIRTYKPSTNTAGILKTFPDYKSINFSTSGNISGDDRTLFIVGQKLDGTWWYILYNCRDNVLIKEKKIAHPLSGNNTFPKHTGCSKSGTWLTVGFGVGVPAAEWGNWVMDRDFNYVGPKHPPEHFDHGIEYGTGAEVYVSMANYYFRMPDGPHIPIIPGATSAMSHLSCRGPDGWAYPSSGCSDAPGMRGYDMIYRVRLDGTGTVQVWGFAHGVCNTATYVGDKTDLYPQPSRDGAKVLFSSKWAAPETPATEVYAYVAEMPDGPYFISPSKVSVSAGQNFSYLVKYTNTLGTPVTLTYLKKPSWVTTTKGDSVTGVAPASAKTDSLIAVISASGLFDTLKLAIVVAQHFAFEAESGTLASPMQKGSSAEASGGQYITTAAGTGNTISPKAEAIYSFNAPVTTTYYVWLCVLIPSISSTANYGTFIGFNGTFLKPGIVNKTAGQYEWIMSPSPFKLNAGVNQLILGHGNEQVEIDRIIITNNPEDILPVSYTRSLPLDKKNLLPQKQNLNMRITPDGTVHFLITTGLEGIHLSVHDIFGRKIWTNQGISKNSLRTASTLVWNPKNGNSKISNGIYFVMLQQKEGSEIGKFALTR